LTASLALDFFVLFSSIVSMTGNHGQSPYIVGNRFLDALAHHRRSRGLPALSVSWGGWALDNDARKPLVETSDEGMDSFQPELGFDMLSLALAEGQTHLGFAPGLSLERWFRHRPELLQLACFEELRAPSTDCGASTETEANLNVRASIENIADPRLRRERLAEHIQREVARILRLEPAAVDRDIPFLSLGLTSLLGIELGYVLRRSLQLKLSATMLYRYASISKLADFLAERLGGPLSHSDPTGRGSNPQPSQPSAAELTSISEEHAASLLRQELQSLGISG